MTIWQTYILGQRGLQRFQGHTAGLGRSKNLPSTSLVLTVGVGRGRNGNIQHYSRTRTATAPSSTSHRVLGPVGSRAR